jgi:hypothetical protein
VNLDTPNGWPAQGEQSDDTWIEYIFYPNSSRIKSYRQHANYAAYLLKRRGGNKDRLLVRIYLAQGKDPSDYQAVQTWLKDHTGRRWSFKAIHDQYDTNTLLPPEHRYSGTTA